MGIRARWKTVPPVWHADLETEAGPARAKHVLVREMPAAPSQLSIPAPPLFRRRHRMWLPAAEKAERRAPHAVAARIGFEHLPIGIHAHAPVEGEVERRCPEAAHSWIVNV